MIIKYLLLSESRDTKTEDAVRFLYFIPTGIRRQLLHRYHQS